MIEMKEGPEHCMDRFKRHNSQPASVLLHPAKALLSVEAACRRAAWFSLLLICMGISIATPVSAFPSFDAVKKDYQKSDALLLDRRGEAIHELRVDPKGRRLDWAALKDISPALVKSVLLSEDRRFFSHGGVDWKAAGLSLFRGVFGDSRRGASTITMQLASMLDKDLRPKNKRRTLGQKWDQMKAAHTLEEGWNKEQILEAYLNLVTFRGELQGISAAARGLFNKEPQGLNEPEALILASLIRSPNAGAREVAKRACMLQESMKSDVACTDIGALADSSLSAVYAMKQRSSLAPHAARILLKAGQTSVATTLDGRVQQFAFEALRQQLAGVRAQNVTDGAVIVAANRTGEVLAYVGSSGPGSPSGQVDGIRARRQAGSTLKPFLYALAFEQGLLTPASLLHDSPLDLSTGVGIYKPQNYDPDFKGIVSVRTALASSLNVPAVRTIDLTGPGSFIGKLRDLGFADLEDEDHYGASAALGSVDITLWDLVNAYRVLANGGRWSPLKLQQNTGGSTSRRVLTEGVAYQISDILSDRQARSLTFGLESPLATRFWTAVKTGTSKDMRDNWCVGYSDRYTVGVWVGNFSGRPMWNVSGITGAAPVWAAVMGYLHRDRSSHPPKRPQTLVERTVDFGSYPEPPRSELFLEGTEPVTALVSTAGDRPGILYPPDGAVVAIDPDIPEENQHIMFEASTAAQRFSWLLNGALLGPVRNDTLWRPKEGRYLLALADENNKVVDAVTFEVRGGR